jgi:hypothetical protein
MRSFAMQQHLILGQADCAESLKTLLFRSFRHSRAMSYVFSFKSDRFDMVLSIHPKYSW